MARGFLDIAGTPSVKAAQTANGVVMRSTTDEAHTEPSRLTAAEAQFIAACDSFYLASVSETGWPYVQHRGGPPGFLDVIGDSTLAFADFRGNRQYISLGNVSANDRVALLLMDYANRRRLKIYARIEAKDWKSEPQLAETLALPGYRAKPEPPVRAAPGGVRLELPAAHNAALHRTRDYCSARAGSGTHRAA